MASQSWAIFLALTRSYLGHLSLLASHRALIAVNISAELPLQRKDFRYINLLAMVSILPHYSGFVTYSQTLPSMVFTR